MSTSSIRSRSWNNDQLDLICFGYVRRNLPHVRIDDIALMISQLICKFQLNFINNEKFCHVYCDNYTTTSTKTKTLKPLSNSNKIIAEFNRFIELEKAD